MGFDFALFEALRGSWDLDSGRGEEGCSSFGGGQ